MSIAKVLFEDEGYHTTYLEEIEKYIKPETSGQDLPQVVEGQRRHRQRRTRSKEPSDERPA